MTRPLRLGIIGCGRVVERFHLPALLRSRTWKVVGVADPSEGRRSWAAERIPGVDAFSAAETLLESCALDAVLVASPPSLHRDHALRALASGAHVLVEKPCGLSAQEALEMAGGATTQGKLLRVAYNRRFHPSYTLLKRRLAGADTVHWAMDFRLAFSVDGWSSHSGYLGQDQMGGGVLQDAASHQLDLIGWLRDSPVAEIQVGSYDRFSDASEEVCYLATLADGTSAECLARHGVGYLEFLQASTPERILLAFSTGLIDGPWREPRTCRRVAGRRAWIDRKLIRTGVRRDPMWVSFARQWAAFADIVAGRPDVPDMADGHAAATLHEQLAGLKMGAQSHRWQTPMARREPRAPSAPSLGRPGGGVQSPEASVVLVVGDQRRRAAMALETVLQQDGIDRVEVLLVDVGAMKHPPLHGSSHPRVQAVRIGGHPSYGQVRAEAVHRASGEVIVFLEEHTRASPGWLRALLDSFSTGPWVAVGPRVVSGNPGIGFSDPMGLINYGDWTGPQTARETDMLPGNNSAYRRRALIELGPELGPLLLADTVLQWRLAEDGGRLFLEPKAVLAHRYPTTLWSAAKGEYLYHVGFAGVRAESFGWPWSLRLGYAAGSLFIPWIRLARMLRARPDSQNREVLRRNILGVLSLLYAAVLGQAAGALFGSRAAEIRFTDYELNEPRPMRGEGGTDS
jgi:predicted dehydrogenase